jgi:hypothetical protein
MNPGAVEVPMDLDGFSHIQRTIIARCIPQGFEKVQQVSPFRALDAFYTPSTCEFATCCHSFAGHCTCARNILALNPCIHVNQSVHSLSPRTLLEGNKLRLRVLPLFKILAITNSWDASRKHIRFSFLFGSGPVTSDGCVRFANSDNPNELVLHTTVSDNSVENCLSACQAGSHSLAGLEKGTQCCT